MYLLSGSTTRPVVALIWWHRTLRFPHFPGYRRSILPWICCVPAAGRALARHWAFELAEVSGVQWPAQITLSIIQTAAGLPSPRTFDPSYPTNTNVMLFRSTCGWVLLYPGNQSASGFFFNRVTTLRARSRPTSSPALPISICWFCCFAGVDDDVAGKRFGC